MTDPQDATGHSGESSDPTERLRPAGSTDPNATAELHRTYWHDESTEASEATPDWSTRPTQDFPAYRPQSYPTYPPTHAPTTELPTVPAAPAAAAGYSTGYSTAAGADRTGATAPTAVAAQDSKPRRRAGAGFAGALALIGLCATAAGALALPLQRFPQGQNAYFGNYRDVSTHRLAANAGNQHSMSRVGGHIATDWWRFGVFTALGVLALLFLIMICVPVLRRLAGVLLFLGGLGAAAGFLLGAHQTNDYRSAAGLGHITRVNWQHLAYGFWVAVGGCLVVALAGLIASMQSTRR